MAQQKIRIRLKGYDHQQVDRSASQIVETAQRTGATITGPVPLPTEKNVYCVIRSPFKDKDSREHFEVRTHKRLIDIHSPTPKTVDSLMRLDAVLAQVADLAAAELPLGDRLVRELHGVVAVRVGRLDLYDRARARLDHGYGRHRSRVGVEHLAHAELFSEDAFHVSVPALDLVA